MTIPTTEPGLLYTGDTWTWQRELSDYSAADGWVLKYVLINASAKINITASASDSAHLVSVAASTTDDYTAGTYTWQAYVEKTTQRFTVGQGTLTVRAGLFAAAAGAEMRSQAKIALDAATTALATYTASNGHVSEYEIAGRRMRFRSVKELRELVNYWASEVQREVDAENIRRGLGASRKIYTRFM